MTNRWNFPNLGVGLSLVSKHYGYVLQHRPKIDFFELISENFMQTQGYSMYVLDRLVDQYPVLMHGVGMSISSSDPLCFELLGELKKLVVRARQKFISDHLCWTGICGHVTHDFLPCPYNEEALAHVVSRLKIVQDFLEVPVLMENPSSYLEYTSSSMPEWEFIGRMMEEADSGLLLDVNNVYVSAYNHGFDPKTYIDAIPVERIVCHHLAGHTNLGSWIKDTHSTHVNDPVWSLYQYVQSRTGGRSTLIEWDSWTPEFEVLQAEADLLREYASGERQAAPGPPSVPHKKWSGLVPQTRPLTVAETQRWLHAYIVHETLPANATTTVEEVILPSEGMTAAQRADVYRDQYWFRVCEEMSLYYSAVARFVGREAFDQLIKAYIRQHPPDHFNIFRMRDHFPEFVRTTQLEVRCREFVEDLAKVERAGRDAGDAGEGESLKLKDIDSLPPETWSATCLDLKDSIRLLALRYPVQNFLQDAPPPEASYTRPEPTYLMLFRSNYMIQRLPLEAELFALIEGLQQGLTVEAAAERAAGGSPDKVSATHKLIRTLVAHGLVKGMSLPTQAR